MFFDDGHNASLRDRKRSQHQQQCHIDLKFPGIQKKLLKKCRFCFQNITEQRLVSCSYQRVLAEVRMLRKQINRKNFVTKTLNEFSTRGKSKNFHKFMLPMKSS
jgi:ribosomal protein S14